MPDDTLNILILAKDEASSVFKNIGGAAKKAFKAISVGAIASGTAIVAGLGLALREAAMTEEIINELNQVIESTGGVAGVTSKEAQELAKSFQSVTKFSDEVIMRGETLLLTFTNIGEDVFPRTVETMLNMGEAFGSVDGAAIQLGKALNDPVAGISALADIGVSFTAEQKKLVEQMVATGDIMGAQSLILDELEREFGGVARAAGKGLAGQLTILKNKFQDIGVAIGNQLLPFITRLVSGIIGITDKIPVIVTKFQRLLEIARDFGLESGRFELMSNIIGGKIPKSVFKVVFAFEAFGDRVGKAFDYVNTIVQDTIHQWGKAGLIAVLRSLFKTWDGGLTHIGSFLTMLGVGKDLAQDLGIAFNFVANIIVTVLNTAFELLTQTIIPFVRDHFPALRNAFIAIAAVIAGVAIYGQIMSIVAAITALANPITWIVIAIALLAVAWTEDWLGIKSAIMDDVWPALKPILSDIQEWLEVFLPAAGEALKKAWDEKIVPAMTTIVEYWNVAFKPALLVMWGWFRAALPAAIDFLVKAWDKFKSGMSTLVEYWNVAFKPALLLMWGYIKNFIPNAINTIKRKWGEFKNSISTLVEYWNVAFKPALLVMWGYLRNFIPNAINSVKRKFTELKEKAFQIATDFIVNTVVPALITLRDSLTSIKTRVTVIANQVKGVFLTAWTTITDYISGTAQGIWDALKSSISMIRSKISAVTNFLNGAFTTAITTVSNFIKSTVQPIWDAFKTAAEFIYGAISDLATSFTGTFLSALETIQPFIDALGVGFDAIKTAMEPIEALISGIGDAIDLLPDIPDWAKVFSPPPFAQGLDYIRDAAKGVVPEIDSLTSKMRGLNNVRGAVSDISNFGRNATSGTQGRGRSGFQDMRNIQYTLIVNSNAQTEPVQQDFRSMQAWNRSI